MDVNRLFSTFRTASSGMAAQRQQIAVAAENIANSNTTRVEDGDGPYKPKAVQASAGDRREFENMLRDSLLDLRQTRGEHLEKGGEAARGGQSQDMGPRTDVVEMEKFRYEYDPHHPDADANGMVKYPDLDLVEEITKMVSANRLFEANLSVIEAEKNIIRRSFEIS